MELITAIIMMFFVLRALYPVWMPLLRKIRFPNGKRTANIFEPHYIQSKAFYLFTFREVPCTTYVDDIDMTSAFSYLNNNYAERIRKIYQACYFNKEQDKEVFAKTLFVMKNKMMVEMASGYVKILYRATDYVFAKRLLRAFSGFKLPEKEKAFEISIITFSNDGLNLKRLDIKPTKLDLSLYYNDDFIATDKLIRTRLNQQNDKGIVLLHGLPGTGKTTYLRHLIGELEKRVLFVSPSVAGNLMNPEFIDLLIDNPNSILVIEDAENIIMDRKYNSDSSVSNLLNLSDGLLSDCLSVQIICTFNSSVSMIDSALMRKGRLIAKYEFGKLGVEKAGRLSKHLGFDTVIDQSMTIAEIANPSEKQEVKQKEMIGFRMPETLMN